MALIFIFFMMCGTLKGRVFHGFDFIFFMMCGTLKGRVFHGFDFLFFHDV